MKVFLILILIGVLVSLNVDAQWVWAQAPIQGLARSKDIITDVHGNTYVVGSADLGGAVFEGLPPIPEGVFFILKIDSNGNNLWIKSPSTANAWSEAECVAIDNEGNVFISGKFNDTLTVDNITLTTQANTSVFILKLKTNGSAEWLRQPIGESIRVWDMATDTAGSVYLCGGFRSPSAQFDTVVLFNNAGANWPEDYNTFIVKYFSNGDFGWAKGSGGDYYDFAYGITTTPQGYIYLAGTFTSENFYLGADTLYRYGYGNYYLLKYDLDGNAFWSRTSDESTYTGFGDDVSSDSLGNAYLCMLYFDSLQVGQFHADTSGYTDHAMGLIKYTPSGSVEWLKSVNDMCPWTCATDKSGNTIICSWDDVFEDTAIFNFDSIELVRPNDFANSTFLSWCNSSGQFECASELMTSGLWGQIAVDDLGNGYYTGSFFDSLIVGNSVLYSSSTWYSQMFYTRFNCDFSNFSTALDLPEFSFSIYPNPTSSSIQIQLSDNIKNYSVKIFNTLGQLLIETKNEQTLDVKFLETGLYIIQLQTEQGTYTQKLIKQ